MRASSALLALLAARGCSALCGGKHLYLFWDENCGGSGADSDGFPPMWIISHQRPDTTRQENLLGGCDGNYVAIGPKDSFEVTGRYLWRSWDGCCATESAERFNDVNVEEVDPDGRVRVSGLCSVAGGVAWVNQVYNVSGTTTKGRRWYTSSEVGDQYDGVIHEEPELMSLGLILGLVSASAILIFMPVLFILWSKKVFCFRRRRRQMTLEILTARRRQPSLSVQDRYGTGASEATVPPVQYGGTQGQYGNYGQGQYGQSDQYAKYGVSDKT